MERPRTAHAQVTVDGKQVDRGLAGLFRLVWRLGIETCQSCENDGGSGLAWIQFPDETSALKFFMLARKAAKFIEWENVGRSSFGQDFEGHAWDVVSLRFPREDLPQVRRALRLAQNHELDIR